MCCVESKGAGSGFTGAAFGNHDLPIAHHSQQVSFGGLGLKVTDTQLHAAAQSMMADAIAAKRGVPIAIARASVVSSGSLASKTASSGARHRRCSLRFFPAQSAYRDPDPDPDPDADPDPDPDAFEPWVVPAACLPDHRCCVLCSGAALD